MDSKFPLHPICHENEILVYQLLVDRGERVASRQTSLERVLITESLDLGFGFQEPGRVGRAVTVELVFRRPDDSPHVETVLSQGSGLVEANLKYRFQQMRLSQNLKLFWQFLFASLLTTRFPTAGLSVKCLDWSLAAKLAQLLIAYLTAA